MTVRQLLTANGYNMSNVPKDAIMVTSDAWSDVDEKYVKTSAHSNFKGINIDELNAKEQKKVFWHVGEDMGGCIGKTWNTPASGNACWFKVV